MLETLKSIMKIICKEKDLKHNETAT